MMEALLQDIRYGARMLRKSPVFTLVVIVTLALGIGANTAIFSVINAVLLQPLPFSQPDRVVSIFETSSRLGTDRETLSPANFRDLASQNQVFSSAAVYLRTPGALTGQGDATRVRIVESTSGLFDVLAVAPIMGRAFLPDDSSRSHGRVVILSHHLWSTQFGMQQDIVGKTIHLDGEDYGVIGIMPEGFQFPLSGSEVWTLLPDTEKFWSPRGAHYLSGIARLKPGITEVRAKEDLRTVGARLAASYPSTNKGSGLGAVEFKNALVGDVKPALLVLLASVGLVVLIACANIANLILARSTERSREVAVRTALGATPFRLARQLLTESLLLSILGALAGLSVAAWAIKIILLNGPQDIPRVQGIHLDGIVLAFNLTLAVITGLAFGLLPALHATRSDVNRSLKSGARTAGDHEGKWLHSSLVACELALSLVLLAGAGLLLRSFMRLQSVDPGFNPQNILTFDLSLPEAQYKDGRRVSDFTEDLLQGLKSLPGVESAAVVTPRPLSGNDYSSSVKIKGQPPQPPGEEKSAQMRVVSGDYFRVMQIPLLRGREFENGDRRETPPVVVLSSNAVKKFFPAGDAIGQHMEFGASIGFDKVGGEVVGIVGNVHDFGQDTEPPPDAYVLQDQAGVGEMSVLVRTKGEPTALAAAARDTVHRFDSGLPIAAVSTMSAALGESSAQRRFYMLLLTLFAGLAISLAAVGVYGVMAYSVTRRTQEIGIRLALGAKHQQVLGLVMSHAASLVAVGLVIGLLVTAASGRVLAGLLFGVRATDPLILIAVTVGLAMVALAAGYIPARRVLRVDPMVALRDE
jgi:putative ABC transport system permease protein